MGHAKKTWRELPATVGTGNFGRWYAQCVKGLASVVEACCKEPLLRIFTKHRVTTERIMHGNMHNVASTES